MTLKGSVDPPPLRSLLPKLLKNSKNSEEIKSNTEFNNNDKDKSTLSDEIVPPDFKWDDIVWRNVFLISSIHIFAIIGLFHVLTGQMSVSTFLIAYVHGTVSGYGITAGAHRLWSHRAYKAKLPMRIFLAYAHSIAFQNSIYEWVRDHRVHHKFTETNADPHNALRGFFFSHVGWLLVKKHDDVKVKGQTVDMSDLEADPVVMFQKKHFIYGASTISFAIPTLLPWLISNDTFFVCACATMARYVISLNCTWLVNSAAHIWGHKPYDSTINPTENKVVAMLANGEGWHNYHHVFPYDYKAAELGNYRFNFTTAVIDTCAYFGLAYDLKTVPKSIVNARSKRTGDGSRHHDHQHHSY